MIKLNKDKIGIWTSFVCLIHCLVLPIFATALPSFFEGPIEWILISIAVIVGSISFIDNFLKHKYFLSLALFFVGFLLIFTSKLLDEELINLLGLITLMISHYLNYQKIKQIDGCHPHGCKH